MKRWCKRPPALRATGAARQTPPGARSRSRRPARAPGARTFEGGPPECAGRSLEAAGNGRRRWMVAPGAPRGSPGQNPAYRPARPHHPSDLRTRSQTSSAATRSWLAADWTDLASDSTKRPELPAIRRSRQSQSETRQREPRGEILEVVVGQARSESRRAISASGRLVDHRVALDCHERRFFSPPEDQSVDGSGGDPQHQAGQGVREHLQRVVVRVEQPAPAVDGRDERNEDHD